MLGATGELPFFLLVYQKWSRMNLASLFVDKFFEYLLKGDFPPSNQSVTSVSQFFPPPWSLDPKKFASLCNGCGDCVTACTEKLLTLGKDGLPTVDFSNDFCTFCGDCARICSTGALHFEQEIPPWNVQVSINENCLLCSNVLCRTCGEQCDREAIIFPKTLHEGQPPEILSEQCDGCGACYGTCPVNAIIFKRKNEQQSTLEQTLE